MGSFYTNLTVGTADASAVADVLSAAGRSAFVTPAIDGNVVVFDRHCEDQDPERLSELGVLLSDKLGAPVLAVMNHDDSVLYVLLYEAGKVRDSYDSCPAYFTGEGSEKPEGGNANVLAEVFKNPAAVDPLESVLRASNADQYMFAMERHQALVETLGLPLAAVGMGYNYIEEEPSELEGVTFDKLIRVG